MTALRELERLRTEFGPGAAERKLALLGELERARQSSAAAVLRLHEALLFLRAYADDERVRARSERMLSSFERRADLRRFRAELEDSGIAGTDIRYPFYAATAFRLAQRCPGELQVDWEPMEDRHEQVVLDRLELLTRWAESPAVDEIDLGARQWLGRLKRPGEGDGAFLARSYAALEAEPVLRELLYDELQPPLVLRAGVRSPSRTLARARLAGRPFVYQRMPLRRERPELRAAVERKPRVRALSPAEGARMVELAQDAMVTRSRDLEVFAQGDPRDVRLLECGDGLAFAAIGFRPERRLLLEAVYGFLTLRNDVPIGYVLNSALFGSAEVAFNVFDAFRGAEAGHVYGWALACVRHLFGVDTFTIYPYQLGQDNDEAIESGAWWFYQKLGFRPRDRSTLALMRRELGRIERKAGYRSPRATLEKLADHNVYWSTGRERRDVIGEVPLARIALAASRLLSQRHGSDRERGERELAAEAARRFGPRSQRGWTATERLAWRRWGPLLCALRGVERWSAAEKRAAVAAIRAKGGARESDFVRRFDAHRKLRAAVLALGTPGSSLALGAPRSSVASSGRSQAGAWRSR